MRKDIILHLANKLDELQAEIDSRPKVHNAETDDEFRAFDLSDWAVRYDCGFAGCMVGWAGLRNWLEPFGHKLQLIINEHGDLLPILNGCGVMDFHRNFAELLEIDGMTLDDIIMTKGYTHVILDEGREVEPRDVAAKLRHLAKAG